MATVAPPVPEVQRFLATFQGSKLPETTSLPLKNRLSQKETIAFQPSIFRGELFFCFGEGSFRTRNFSFLLFGGKPGCCPEKEKVASKFKQFLYRYSKCSNSSGCEEGRLPAWIRNHMKSVHVQTHLIESTAFQLHFTGLKPSTFLPSNTWWRQAQACFQISRGFNINDICSAWKLAWNVLIRYIKIHQSYMCQGRSTPYNGDGHRILITCI